MIKSLSEKLNDEEDVVKKAKDIVKIGDKVVFARLLSDDYRVWFLPSQEQMDKLKTRLSSIAKVIYVEKSYRDKKNIDYYLDVEFADGSYMKRVNVLCFKKLFPNENEEEPDFEWI